VLVCENEPKTFAVVTFPLLYNYQAHTFACEIEIELSEWRVAFITKYANKHLIKTCLEWKIVKQ
jgi:hypothetical protein